MIPRRTLGLDAPPVSAVGYGGMHLSIQDRPPEAQSIRVIHAALDAGVTLIDTADVTWSGADPTQTLDAVQRAQR